MGLYSTLGARPRAVPLAVRCQVLFGGLLNQIGWILFGFGMIFVWVLGSQSDLSSWVAFRGEVRTVQGRVVGSEATNCRQGRTCVYAVRYAFEAPDGTRFEGTSFAPGAQLQAGETVTVEYPAADPAVSRIQGMRRAPMGSDVLFVVIFPLIGLAFILSGLRSGLRATRLLAHGVVGAGKLVAKTPTSARISGRPVYRLTFEFVTPEGHTARVAARSHTPEVLEDEALEPLLFLREDPGCAVLMDALPGSPRIGPMDEVEPRGSLAVVLVPLVVLAGNGLAACFCLLR